MHTQLESAQVDQIVSIYSNTRLYYNLNSFFHRGFCYKSIVEWVSGSLLEILIEVRVHNE